MRKAMIVAWVTILNVATALYWTGVSAQTPLGSPQLPLVITQADIKHMLSVNQEDTSLGSTDAGKFIVDVWLDQRGANPRKASAGMLHTELTEIYVVQRGSATLRAGGTLGKSTENKTLPNHVSPGGAMFKSPTFSGSPWEGGKTWEVGVGDIVVMPPNVVHQWDGIPQEMRYVIVRVDPEKRQKPDFVQPLMKR